MKKPTTSYSTNDPFFEMMVSLIVNKDDVNRSSTFYQEKKTTRIYLPSQ